MSYSSNSDSAFVSAAIFMIIISMVTGGLIGGSMVEKWKNQEAVNNKAAYWTVDDHGKTKMVWKTQIENEVKE
jgi:hypothetical protein